jgi:hypothetical protein
LNITEAVFKEEVAISSREGTIFIFAVTVSQKDKM